MYFFMGHADFLVGALFLGVGSGWVGRQSHGAVESGEVLWAQGRCGETPGVSCLHVVAGGVVVCVDGDAESQSVLGGCMCRAMCWWGAQVFFYPNATEIFIPVLPFLLPLFFICSFMCTRWYWLSFFSQGTAAVWKALVRMQHPLSMPGLGMHRLLNYPEVLSPRGSHWLRITFIHWLKTKYSDVECGVLSFFLILRSVLLPLRSFLPCDRKINYFLVYIFISMHVYIISWDTFLKSWVFLIKKTLLERLTLTLTPDPQISLLADLLSYVLP